MKTKLLLLLFTVIFATSNLHAADFTADGIVYTITSATAPYTVAVRSKSPVYTGTVTIPASVTNSGTTYSVTSIGNEAFIYCGGVTSVTIPNSVTSVGLHAFAGCTGLTSLSIPSSVTSFGNGVFQGCSGFTSFTIPSSLTSIVDNAFNNCSGLTSVTIPNSVTSIGAGAFNGCSGLPSVSIPNSVTAIGDWAFAFCRGLTSVTIPNSVTSIGSSAFGGCNKLSSATISNSATSIRGSTFSGCSVLTSVPIPNSVTSIENFAFENCSGLTVVAIPSSVTFIGDFAFKGCSGLTSFYADSPTPIALNSNSNVFFNVNKTTCTLYVPKNSKSMYAAANIWKDFTNIVEHAVGIANLFNGEFDNSTQNWNFYYAAGAAATMKIDNNSVISGPNSCAVTISQTTGTDWNIQLWQSLSVYQDHKYTISFKAKASAPRSIALVLQKYASPYTTYLNKTHDLTTQVKTFTDTVTMHTTDLAAKIQFSLGTSTASVWIDDITIIDTPLITGIDETVKANGNISLLQNYPNPFNKTTKIIYKVPEPGFVSLKVFNAIGTEVTSLVNEKKPVGEYSIEWNASGLQSGIYFCRMQNRNNIEVKKMIVQK